MVESNDGGRSHLVATPEIHARDISTASSVTNETSAIDVQSSDTTSNYICLLVSVGFGVDHGARLTLQLQRDKNIEHKPVAFQMENEKKSRCIRGCDESISRQIGEE